MTPERWQQVEKLFQCALERAPAERAAFLDEACAGDESLRKELESLISADEQAGRFIEPSAFETATQLFADEQAEFVVEELIGPYRVIREIGRGGMGAVYLAVRADDQYHKRVAIKLIRRGMDSHDIIRRFLSERQILAALDHPNIARLFDGGTTDDDLPYFVMEHIEGKPLIDYCDTHKLNTVERLKLFRSVCSAVRYAHQNLVVHRDIKPGNILITEDGTAKLLDFGIAKLLNPELGPQTIDPTATAMRMMTPDYASPEQVRGDTITTASDVYSLGVVLYELLTGHRPYRLKSRLPHEMLRVICEEEPEKPSTAITRVEEVTTSDGAARITVTPESVSKTREGRPDKLRRRLEGDLDNIVLKALRKEPQRRYSSVEQFSEDIRRHLEGLPVMARKDTLWYRSGKFIKRHRAGAIAAGLIMLALLAGLVATLWQAHLVSVQKARAERRFNDVRRLANSFMFEFHDEIANIAGTTRARELLVKRALEYLDSLAQEAGSDRSLQRELATAYEKVGDIQGRPFTPNLGDTPRALESYRKAIAIREAISAADPADAQAQRELAATHGGLGDMLFVTGDIAGVVESRRKALAIYESLSATNPKDPQARRDLALGHLQLGNALSATGDMAGAVDNHRKATTIYEELVAADPANAENRIRLAASYANISNMYLQAGDAKKALELQYQAVAINEQVLAASPANAEIRHAVAGTYVAIANILAAMGNANEALEHYRKATAIREDLTAANPTNAQMRSELAACYIGTGKILSASGSLTEALESFRKGAAIYEALEAADPANVEIRSRVADSFLGVGNALAATGDRAGVIENHRKALDTLETMAATDPTNIQVRSVLASSYLVAGTTMVKTGDLTEALKKFSRAQTIFEALLAAGPANAGFGDGLITSLLQLGDSYALLASNARTPAERQAEYWHEARSCYQRCSYIFQDLRNRDVLKGHDSGRLDQITHNIAAQIARCDTALANLNAR